MKHYFYLLASIFFLLSCEETITEDEKSFATAFEKSTGNTTATYSEVIDYYLQLAKTFPEINVQTIGETDSGNPLHLVTYNPDGNFNFQKIREEKNVLLINNGIHPGEPDGIDATMMLFRNLVLDSIPTPTNLVVATIPVYNVGGMLNRNSTSRANQNGPEAYGFRGNARNYDLNRDFVKMDTKNAATFASIFHLVQPDVFIDNHVSNGADYQYVLTHLFTQHNKLQGSLGAYLHDELRPSLESALEQEGWAITPYVNVFNRPPDGGFTQFMDHPRYSTGYTTLWHTLGMMVETHMLKPYQDRVLGTLELMEQMVAIVDANHKDIRKIRTEAIQKTMEADSFFHGWTVDSTKSRTLNFKGFEADTILSEITGSPRLKYNLEAPFEKPVTYYDHFVPKDTITIPEAYIIKKGWSHIANMLNANNVEYVSLETDTVLTLESYRIESFETYQRPYEGHYPHYNTTVSSALAERQLEKGDLLVPVRQNGLRYIMETLEPEAVDSFFNWNYFDTVLQQKEGFSPYVFEDLALSYLEENPAVLDSLNAQKMRDEGFANNWYAQLNWIFKNSPYYEKAHLQYPIYRVMKDSEAHAYLKDKILLE